MKIARGYAEYSDKAIQRESSQPKQSKPLPKKRLTSNCQKQRKRSKTVAVTKRAVLIVSLH